MKINWGTGIVLAFIGFISFILFFVVSMLMDDRTNHDLVREDYYQAEMGFQKELDAEINSHKNNVDLKLVSTSEGLRLEFPKELDQTTITGTVTLYRPSDKQLDFDLPITLSNNNLLIPEKRLPAGRWNIKVSWEYKGEAYMFKDKITY
ncbi:FixH family protein [Arenibacter certesii]|uniref:Cytochrome Cbb3 oxidase maturation protein CcoH n=1 Tax=Arenibacter certesii TaxID=228955 RepID=A0A918IW49_9FLAO|nr:FixH family protein [Arenibacter certesii]GGW35631.1 cytochrome Cbb3 oxidase maturation protein CcoH [Arenibacter certesii]